MGNKRQRLWVWHFWYSMLFCQGAATTCYVALHPSLKEVTGKYFADCNEVTPSKLARDETLAQKLWDFSVKLINSVSKKNYLGFEDTI